MAPGGPGTILGNAGKQPGPEGTLGGPPAAGAWQAGTLGGPATVTVARAPSQQLVRPSDSELGSEANLNLNSQSASGKSTKSYQKGA